MRAEIRPYRISVGDDVLDDLKSRLRRTRWPEAELVGDWSQGAPLEWIKDICHYWAEDIRLAPARSAPQSLCAVHDRDRRARYSLPARPLAASGSDAADHHPWLAGLDRRISQGDRAADRSDRAWRQRRRRVSRRLPVIARLWLFGQAGNHRLGRRSHCVQLGGADGSPWIRALRRAGWRLGFGGDDRPWCAGWRTLRRHSHHACDVRPAQRGRRADARGGAGARRDQILRRLGFRLFQAAVDPAADPRLRA